MLQDNQVDKQISSKEEFGARNGGRKALLKPSGDVQYYINLPEKATVQDRTAQWDIKEGTATCREPVIFTADIGSQWLKGLLFKTF